MPQRTTSLRPWLTAAAVATAAVVLLPPVAVEATRYVYVQALQFCVLAFAVPALLILGAPWRGLSRRHAEAIGQTWPAGRSLADRAALSRQRRAAGLRPWVILLGFIALVIVWRLPALVDAVARQPTLGAVEAVTLIPAGCALWLELVESPPLLPRISRPSRALLAAVPMWSTWALAYIMGFSGTTWFTAFAHPAGAAFGTIADQEAASAILWAIPGLCFVPVVFVSLMSWLRDSSDADTELRELTSPGLASPAATPRPPRGWRMPSA